MSGWALPPETHHSPFPSAPPPWPLLYFPFPVAGSLEQFPPNFFGDALAWDEFARPTEPNSIGASSSESSRGPTDSSSAPSAPAIAVVTPSAVPGRVPLIAPPASGSAAPFPLPPPRTATPCTQASLTETKRRQAEQRRRQMAIDLRQMGLTIRQQESELAEYRSMYHNWQNTIALLLKRLGALEQQAAGFTKRLLQLTQDLSARETQAGEYEERVTQLKKELAVSEERVAHLEKELKQAALQNQVAEKVSEPITSSLAPEPAQMERTEEEKPVSPRDAKKLKSAAVEGVDWHDPAYSFAFQQLDPFPEQEYGELCEEYLQSPRRLRSAQKKSPTKMNRLQQGHGDLFSKITQLQIANNRRAVLVYLRMYQWFLTAGESPFWKAPVVAN